MLFFSFGTALLPKRHRQSCMVEATPTTSSEVCKQKAPTLEDSANAGSLNLVEQSRARVPKTDLDSL